MHPNLHLALHQARLDDALRRQQRWAHRPRSPGARQRLAAVLHRLADRLEPAPAPAAVRRHA